MHRVRRGQALKMSSMTDRTLVQVLGNACRELDHMLAYALELETALSSVLSERKDRLDGEVGVRHEVAVLAEKQAHEAAMAQAQANAEQAKHPSIFVAGARPAIMWICAAAMAYHFVLQPFLVFGVLVSGVDLPALPELDMASLMPVLMGILGLGGLRSWEKVKGCARDNLKQ